MLWLWVGIIVMGLFSFAESPQLQALLADISPPSIRDATYAVYFTLAFGVGSLWIALYGVIIEQVGEAAGVHDRVRADGRCCSSWPRSRPCRSMPTDAPARTPRSRPGSTPEPAPEREGRGLRAQGRGLRARRSRRPIDRRAPGSTVAARPIPDGSSQAEASRRLATRNVTPAAPLHLGRVVLLIGTSANWH